MWGLVRPLCSVEAEVCVRNKGGKGGHHACMNEHVTASCVIGAESAFSSVIVSVSEKKKREAELSPGPPARFHEWLQQGKLSLIVKLFGRRLFLHHLMLNSSTFLRQFFFLLPLRMSSDQVFLPSCFLLRPKWPRQMYNTPKLHFMAVKQE